VVVVVFEPAAAVVVVVAGGCAPAVPSGDPRRTIADTSATTTHGDAARHGTSALARVELIAAPWACSLPVL
jgi:hypothetical protein